MGKVSAGATMSLDGFIAGPNDSGFDLLFKWYGAGDVELPMPDATAGVPASHVSAASAELMRAEQASWGALVVGRHLYDLTNAWNGRHPLNVTTVVLTHRLPEDRPRQTRISSLSPTESRLRSRRRKRSRAIAASVSTVGRWPNRHWKLACSTRSG